MSTGVIKQYHQEDLYKNILAGLERAGKSLSQLTVEDLWPVDQFHIGGAKSTMKLIQKASINSGDKLLDVGSGLGGPCRLFAQECGCQAYGIDLTPVYIETATQLSSLVGLEDKTHFQVANALKLPFVDQNFDVVCTQHVQMNIESKADFYAELLRVLKPGGTLMYYDLFQGNNPEMIYPTPWSEDGIHSFLFEHSDLEKLLSAEGLVKQQHQGETHFAIDFFTAMLDKIKREGKPVLGLHLVMGSNASFKLQNLLKNLELDAIEVHQGIFKKP